jgi:hypothetical protein
VLKRASPYIECRYRSVSWVISDSIQEVTNAQDEETDSNFVAQTLLHTPQSGGKQLQSVLVQLNDLFAQQMVSKHSYHNEAAEIKRHHSGGYSTLHTRRWTLGTLSTESRTRTT